MEDDELAERRTELNEMRHHQADYLTQDDVNQYLDGLRESGITNMFGAAEYLMKEFDIDKSVARTMLAEWMRTFNETHS